MSLIRVLQSTQATLSHTFTVDEVPTDASAGVTVTVRRLDGEQLATGAAGHTSGVDGVYTFVLTGGSVGPPSLTWQLDELVVEWSGNVGGAVVKVYDTVEVVGGYLFGITELRNEHVVLRDTRKYPAADMAAKRIQTEQECERICRQAWVPRFARETLSGRGRPYLATGGTTPNTMLRKVRKVIVSGTTWTQDQIDAVRCTESGVFTLDGGAVWPAGTGNIVIEYEHGNDAPPETIRSAAMLRHRTRVARPSSSVPDRAKSWTSEDGAVYQATVPSADSTGVPEVDNDYFKYQRARRAVVG